MKDETLNEIAATDYHTAGQESPFAALAEALYRERVIEARRMPPEEKFLAGEELFELACTITLAGIRDQFPTTTDEERLQILRQRLAMRAKWEGRT